MRQKRAEHTKRRCTNTRWDERARQFRNLQAAPAAQRLRLVAERTDRPDSAGRAGPRSSLKGRHWPRTKSSPLVCGKPSEGLLNSRDLWTDCDRVVLKAFVPEGVTGRNDNIPSSCRTVRRNRQRRCPGPIFGCARDQRCSHRATRPSPTCRRQEPGVRLSNS